MNGKAGAATDAGAVGDDAAAMQLDELARDGEPERSSALIRTSCCSTCTCRTSTGWKCRVSGDLKNATAVVFFQESLRPIASSPAGR